MGADGPKLMAILSDDLRYAHASGAVDTKTSFLDAIATGRLKYVSWIYQERNFTFPAPGVALMSGKTRVWVAKADGTAEMLLTFLGVWREEKGQWHFSPGSRESFPSPRQPPNSTG